MIALKLERRGADLVIVFDPEACAALSLNAGDAVHIQRADGAVVGTIEHDMEHEARAARSRAFLRRHQKTFDALAKH
jgi:formylmethanofuran dehydrogenase subunit D